ncbi:murein hydrolase activator EnvC family protein [Streptomyces sp. NPDC053367]|uniref:murein hydrolase activator EnvC family protein n=1 Tax=Streptomyces sp. NPDC053367 TaxID=3365700 RepID=UPI0037D98468
MRTIRYASLTTWALLLALALTVLTPAARADAPPATPSPSGGPDPVPPLARLWPVGPRPSVLRGWQPPATPYGPGHRGVDLAAAPGTEVRAVAAGRVAFAGRVAGKGVVSLELPGGLRTTYEPVRATLPKGAEVTPGQIIGTVEPAGSHCTEPCVHWGLRRGDTYLNPLGLLPPWLLRAGPSRLLPVAGVPVP